MLPQEIIRKKRNGQSLLKEEIDCFVKGLLDQSFSDSQIAAMSMAIFFNNMNDEETTNLTGAMANSGDILKWNKILDSSFISDKHSTGGVGDKVSLLLAPIIAACGGYVPMISGRGLGHTGGTLDKFDSIPGYNTQPNISQFQKIVKDVGCAIIGQTSELAPADKKLYSIRDVVGTVESVPLIVSSILSKKISSGIKNLVIDVKVGNGSFNPTLEIAEKLANALVKVAKNSNLKCSAILTDMNQVLGNNVGNALEVEECIEYFINKKSNNRLKEITNALSCEILCLNNVNLSKKQALEKINKVIEQGYAAEKFEKMVSLLGGPSKILSTYKKDLSTSNYIEDVISEQTGFIKSIETRQLGLLLIELGGGRKNTTDKINYSVGFSNVAGIGKKIEKNMPLLTLHCENKNIANEFKKMISKCFLFSDKESNSKKNIIKQII